VVIESGRPIAQIAHDLGMHPETLRKKVREAEADGGRRGDLLTTQEREQIRRLRKEVYELRRQRDPQGRLGVFCDRARRRPTEVSAFLDQQRDRFGVEPICRILGVSASAYYQRKSGRRSERAVAEERLLGRIGELHAANYHAYGYRRPWKALLRAGERVGRDRVKRLMRAAGIQGAKRRGKPWRTTRPDPQAQRRPDLVRRDFSAEAPKRLWVADLSYLRCWEGLVFFSFVIDAFSRTLVGWQLAPHMRTTLVLDALRMALHQRGPAADVALVHHSDRGSQSEFNRSSQRSGRGVAMGARRRRRSDRAGRPAVRSPGRPPVGRLGHRRRFWAAIARGLSGEAAAAEAGVSAAVGVRWFRGGWRDAVGRPGPRRRGGTCRLPSGRRSLFFGRVVAACGRSRGCSGARRPRSRGSCVAMPRPAAAGSSTGPAPRGGMPTVAAGVRSRPSSP
jgi:transposase InsO family protein/transposase-like protein